MYIALNRVDLKFEVVHSDQGIVHNLSFLECSNLPHIIFDNTFRPGFLSYLTTLELNLLYRNSTHGDFAPFIDDLTRREVLAQIVDTMKPRHVVTEELTAQIQAVLYNLEETTKPPIFYRYVLGALSPQIVQAGLFPLTTAPASAETIASAAVAAPQSRSVVTAPTIAPRNENKASSAPRGPVSGARPTIWAHADKVWEEAGKPKDIKVVLVLRKRMMTELEQQDIKKTTSSTALGDWMKERLKM